jgi:RimJ/RimL family protein N-acetyltransferase
MRPVFETDRLVVRYWEPADAERVFDIYSRWEVARWLGSDPKPMESLEAAQRSAERLSMPRDDPTFGMWAVCTREDVERPLGSVLLVPVPDAADGAIEVGWHFHPDSWGHGYATEAAAGALQRGWDAGLERIIAITYPGNEPSQAVCRRLGMTHQGLTTAYYGIEAELFTIERASAATTGLP